MTNSKQIGNNYEREFSKKLSMWVSKGERDDIFWRDLSSGARATVRKKKNKQSVIKGDIVATDLEYKKFTDKFYIDTKCYKECDFLFINSNNMVSNRIFQEWIKTVKDCPDGMWPIMPVKIRDRKTPDFIIFEAAFPNYFIEQYCLYHVVFKGIIYRFILILQNDFFENNTYESLLENI